MKEEDINAGKKKVLLELLNKILANTGKQAIAQFSEFKDIDRIDLLKEANIETFEAMKDEIYKYFDKGTTGHYRKNHVQNYLIVFLKLACKDIGTSFKSKKKNSSVKSRAISHTYYSIYE